MVFNLQNQFTWVRTSRLRIAGHHISSRDRRRFQLQRGRIC